MHGSRRRGSGRALSNRALGAAAMLATVVGAFATGGANLAITLLVLFAGLTVAGYLFGLDVRDRSRGGGNQIPDDRRPSPGS